MAYLSKSVMHIKVNLSEWKLYDPISVKSQFDNLYLLLSEKVTTKSMQIHSIMVLIYNTCAVINHLFSTLWSMAVMHFFND